MNVVPNTLIGQEIERTEDLRFLTGTGTFVDDYEPAGTVHAAILRSSVAHGRIIGLNKEAALKIEGVHAVLDASDVGAAIPTTVHHSYSDAGPPIFSRLPSGSSPGQVRAATSALTPSWRKASLKFSSRCFRDCDIRRTL